MRGSTYSRNHIFLHPDRNRTAFWDFSWHEIGIYDVPATIDYILNRTEKSKLHYIGHSQGTTVFFVMCSERPEYNEKILLANMFAPAVYLSPKSSIAIRVMSNVVIPLGKVASLLGLYEMFPNSRFNIEFAKNVCSNTACQQVCLQISISSGKIIVQRNR